MEMWACRQVPLSEGRVHDGTLECAYHGWEFDGSGKPVVIPQVSLAVAMPPLAYMQALACCN